MSAPVNVPYTTAKHGSAEEFAKQLVLSIKNAPLKGGFHRVTVEGPKADIRALCGAVEALGSAIRTEYGQKNGHLPLIVKVDPKTAADLAVSLGGKAAAASR